MPHVTLKLYAGRSNEEKAKLADALAEAVIATIGSAETSVSVSIEDVERSDWPGVYRDEIVGRPDTLYRKPGYTM